MNYYPSRFVGYILYNYLTAIFNYRMPIYHVLGWISSMRSNKRKGVSPIISVLLLILIAVAAGVMTYVFVAGWIGSATTSTTVVQGQLSVDYADANASADTLTIYLRNVGGVALSIDSIYIEKAGGGLVTVYSPTTGNTLGPGDVTQLTVSASLNPGEVYTIRIATKEGTTIVFSVKAHS